MILAVETEFSVGNIELPIAGRATSTLKNASLEASG